jgi:hypothetical protein
VVGKTNYRLICAGLVQHIQGPEGPSLAHPVT